MSEHTTELETLVVHDTPEGLVSPVAWDGGWVDANAFGGLALIKAVNDRFNRLEGAKQ